MKLSGLAIILIALALAAGATFLLNKWLDAQEEGVWKLKEKLEEREESLDDREFFLNARNAALEQREAKLAQPNVEVPVKAGPRVLVAAKDLPVDTKIDAEAVQLREATPIDQPEFILTQDRQLIESLAKVLNRFVIKEVAEGDIIRESFLEQEATSALMSNISDGKRAITFDIGVTAGQMKSITPGNRVDVLLGSGGLNEEPRNRLLLQNIKVLALDQRIDPREAVVGDEIQTPGTVTLEVTPKQAKLLALAASGNNVRILLRNQSDTRSLDTHALNVIRGTDQCDTFTGQNCQ